VSRFRTSRVVPLAVLALATGMLTATAVPAAAATAYAITDLGSLGHGVSDGLAINAADQVTGYSYTGVTVPTSGCCGNCYSGKLKPCVAQVYHAFLYSDGTVTGLGALGGTYSQGMAINRTGQLAGWADTKARVAESFLWNGKTMTGPPSLSASAINDTGQVTGTCGSNPGLHACLDSNGTTTQLPDPGSFTPINCGASAINNNGQIAGGCADTSSDQQTALWPNGTATGLGTFGDPQASAAAISNLGQVAGWAQTSADADRGFLYSNGKMTDLGLNFFPAAVNDNGQIVADVYGTATNQTDALAAQPELTIPPEGHRMTGDLQPSHEEGK
jgi:probable HAF family extracellular repeat protein